MYKTIVKYKYMDKKSALKILVPLFTWFIMFFVILFVVTRGIWWMVPIMFLEFLCCIPIAIFGLKVKRNLPYIKKMIDFEIKDNLLYANDIPIASVMYEKKKERIKLIFEEGCGFIEKPYIDGFVTFLMSNLIICNKLQVKNIDKMQNKEEISEQLQSELDKHSEEGNKYFDNNEYDKALKIWKKALELIPEPKKNFSESVWFLTSIGDIYFMQGKYEEAFNNFEDAKNNLSGDGINNPFILLRLGQSAFELGKKDFATENLLRAYMLEGKEIFEEDDKKYFEFLKSNIDLDN